MPEEVTPKTVSATGISSDCSSEKDENGENENIKDVKEDVLNDGLRNMSEKLSAALVNVNAKEDLVKQHAKVAEEAIAGAFLYFFLQIFRKTLLIIPYFLIIHTVFNMH